MDQFLIEVFTNIFSTSGNSILILLAPILAVALSIVLVVGFWVGLAFIWEKVADIYYDSEAYARRAKKEKIRECQRALDLWEHGYIEYYKGDKPGGGRYHYIVPKAHHVGTDVYNESQAKAHVALMGGLVPNKKLPRGAGSVIAENYY